MFYFKQIEIDNSNAQIVEKAIRAYSKKRHTSLDFIANVEATSDDKYFLGLENNNDIILTRLRTRFEWYFPKIIIRFQKNKGFSSFQIRYSILSSIVFCAFVVGLVSNLLYLSTDYFAFENVLLMVMVLSLFTGLTFLEIAIARKRISKAIQKTTEAEFLNI
jgi:hypothetical protein